jgi:hypothetical protein
MTFIKVNKTRLLAAIDYHHDDCVITSDDDSLYVSSPTGRIRLPIHRKQGYVIHTPVCFSGFKDFIQKTINKDITIIVRKKDNEVSIKEYPFAKFPATRSTKGLLMHNYVRIDKPYPLPPIYWDITTGLECKDGRLIIKSIEREFYKYNTQIPDFKLNNYVIKRLREFDENDYRLLFCEDNYLLLRSEFNLIPTVNMITKRK